MSDQYLSTDPNAGQAVTAAAPPPPIPRDARGRPTVSSSLSDGPASPLMEMLGPLAHPETLTDFARLLTLPVDSVRKALVGALTTAAARPAAASAMSATGRGMERAGAALEEPAKLATAYEMVTAPKKAVLTFAAPKVLQGAGRMLQRGGAALAEAPAVAEAAPVVEAAPAPPAAPVTAAPVNALPDQKLLNELAIQARRAGVKLTPQMEKVAIEAVGKGATPQQAVRSFASAAPAEVAPAAPSATAPVKFRLSSDESKVFARLIREGKSDAEARSAIETARAFQERFGTPTPTPAETRFPKGMRGKSEGD